jgi:transposase, IS5 family
VIDFAVYDKRLNDPDLLSPAIEIHQAMLGRAPYVVAADAAFSIPARTRALRKPRVSSLCAFPTAHQER